MAYVTLRVLHGADRGKVFERLATPVTIGREEGNTIQLNDERISRYHLKFQEDNDKVVLTDLESTNGTKVNGEDIQVRIVRDGDMIALGRSLILVGSQTDIDRRIAEIAARLPEGEEGREGDQVGVLRRQAKRGAGGFLGKQATFPAEGLRNGNQDAVTAEGKLVDDEAFGRTLRGDF